jgi:hypothetical protein
MCCKGISPGTSFRTGSSDYSSVTRKFYSGKEIEPSSCFPPRESVRASPMHGFGGDGVKTEPMGSATSELSSSAIYLDAWDDHWLCDQDSTDAIPTIVTHTPVESDLA